MPDVEPSDPEIMVWIINEGNHCMTRNDSDGSGLSNEEEGQDLDWEEDDGGGLSNEEEGQDSDSYDGEE